MTKFEFAALFGTLLMGVLFLVSRGDTSVVAAGPHIDLLWKSAADGDQFPVPENYCTGERNPPVHGAARAIDVFGDEDSTPCAGDQSSRAYLRGWGIGGTTFRHTLSAWAFGGAVQDDCDIVNIGLIDSQGGLHGQLQFIHINRTVSSGYAMMFYAAPGSAGGASNGYIVGWTQNDSVNCGWNGYHVHQGTLLDCMDVNTALQPTTIYPITNLYTWIHKFDYAEGLHACDG